MQQNQQPLSVIVKNISKLYGAQKALDDVSFEASDGKVVWGMKQVIIFIIVDFPAPFGPRNPTTFPSDASNETSSSAFWAP